MNITEITKAAGAHRRRKRVGRGEASGHGKTSGRGTKGAGARTGAKERLLFEGGALPIFRRLPKRGFSNFHFRTEYQVVNVGDLDATFEPNSHVTAATLKTAGLIHDADGPVKILGDGTVSKKLTVEAQRFSGQAVKKLESAGGAVKKLGPQPKKKFIPRPPAAKPKDEAGEGKGKGKKGEEAAPQGEAKAKKKPEGGKGKGKKAEGGGQEGEAKAKKKPDGAKPKGEAKPDGGADKE